MIRAIAILLFIALIDSALAAIVALGLWAIWSL